MPHPAYNLVLDSWDYYLFQSMAHFHVNQEEVEALVVNKSFASRDKNWYGIQEMIEG